jgi:SOS response regulatory protein OraA/RecX
MLAIRRLTESQLWSKLERRGYDDAAIADAVAACKRFGYLDDKLYASLYVEGARKAVGDARLIAELVKRGIDRESAAHAVVIATHDQDVRIAAAYEKLVRTKPSLSYPSAARALERLGFPTSLIYRTLRVQAQAAPGEPAYD